MGISQHGITVITCHSNYEPRRAKYTRRRFLETAISSAASLPLSVSVCTRVPPEVSIEEHRAARAWAGQDFDLQTMVIAMRRLDYLHHEIKSEKDIQCISMRHAPGRGIYRESEATAEDEQQNCC